MKHGLSGLLVAVAMFAAPQVMTNQTVEAMVYGGVPLTTIVATIRTATRIQFSETKQDYDRLVAAGGSPTVATEIMKAIHSRQYVGIDRWPARDTTTPVQSVAPHAAPSAAAAPVQVPSVRAASVARTEANSNTTPIQTATAVIPAPAPPAQAPVPASVTSAPARVPATVMRPENATDQEVVQQPFATALPGQNVGGGAAPAPRGPKDAPRVFLQSASKGTNWNAARDQSMEMSKDLERNCPGVKITISQQAADYTVLLNHIERGLIIRDNQVQVANRQGDLITNTREGGSIAGGMKRACTLIHDDWAQRP